MCASSCWLRLACLAVAVATAGLSERAVAQPKPYPEICREIRATQPTEEAESLYQSGLGEYETCFDCRTDPACRARVISRLTAAVDKGHVKAAWKLWSIYTGDRKLKSESGIWGRKAAEIGGPEDKLQWGRIEAGEGNMESGLRWMNLAADQGHQPAMWDLGNWYLMGTYVDRDYSRAAYWYQRLAELGDGGAMVLLGMHYQGGLGVEQDYARAIEWYGRAAHSKQPNQAPLLLGLANEKGLGGTANYAEARHWYEIAARKGLKTVTCRAQYRLGRLYELGLGTKVSIDRALEHYSRAEAADSFQCWGFYEHMATLYSKGKVVPADQDKVAKFKRLASQSRSGFLGMLLKGRTYPYQQILALDE